jgi:uncharacterized ferritin-like protein (DUF455 family)
VDTENHKDTCQSAIGILQIADPWQKAKAVRGFVAKWRKGALPPSTHSPAQDPVLGDHPARPERPELWSPGKMPKRRFGNKQGRASLIHAIAHIEVTAIDLALDMVARFAEQVLDETNFEISNEFIGDWLSVADDEARHFNLLSDQLLAMDITYGDLPAHSGLWDIATRTTDDVLARLALAPLVMEARGLDVTPGMIEKFRNHGDDDNADALLVIYEDEIGHVAIGAKWFRLLAEKRGQNPVDHFRNLVRERFPGGLKPPFNHDARCKAGFGREFYENLCA